MKIRIVHRAGLALLFAALVVGTSIRGQSPFASSFTPLGSLLSGTEFNSRAWDVSADGTTIVGTCFGTSTRLAFIWREETGITLLHPLPTDIAVSEADGISGDGSMAAGRVRTASRLMAACRWTWDSSSESWLPKLLSEAGGGFSGSSYGYAMSADSSVIVGWGYNDVNVFEACRWTWSPTGSSVSETWNFERLGDLPGGEFQSKAFGCSADGKVVVGEGSPKTGKRAFRWTRETGMQDLGVVGTRKFATAWGCSGDGLVVVGDSRSMWGKDQVAFRWTKQTGMVGLGDLPGGQTLSTAEATNNDGSIVVGWGVTARGMEAFVWDANNKMRSVESVLASRGVAIPANWRLKSANGVTSNAGVVTIVGEAVYMINSIEYTEAFRAVISNYM